MKRTSLLVAFAVAAVVVAAVLPASAQSVSVCTFTSQVHISPGVTPTPTPATFTSSDGVISCNGAITGGGTISYSGVTGTLGGGENCAFDFGGTGTLEYVIGAEDVSGPFTFARAAVAGGFTGNPGAGTLVGTFEFQPAAGQDCATVPVTDATVTGQVVLVY